MIVSDTSNVIIEEESRKNLSSTYEFGSYQRTFSIGFLGLRTVNIPTKLTVKKYKHPTDKDALLKEPIEVEWLLEIDYRFDKPRIGYFHYFETDGNIDKLSIIESNGVSIEDAILNFNSVIKKFKNREGIK